MSYFPSVPPLVVGPVSYIGDCPVVVLALGGVGQGFDTIKEAMEYLVRMPVVNGEPQQVFGLIGNDWLEIMPRGLLQESSSLTPRIAAELCRLAALTACEDRGVISDGRPRSKRSFSEPLVER